MVIWDAIAHYDVTVMKVLTVDKVLVLARINCNDSMDKYMPRKIWNKITYSFSNFNGLKFGNW